MLLAPIIPGLVIPAIIMFIVGVYRARAFWLASARIVVAPRVAAACARAAIATGWPSVL